MFIVQISPVVSADFRLMTLRYWNSLLHSLISLGRIIAQFLAACSHSHYQFPFDLAPISAMWTQAVWIQSLPKAITHDWYCRNRTPGPLDLFPIP